MTTDIPTLILQGIRDFSANRPRSLQTEVGPSQLGNPCDHCLTAALVGWQRADDEAWLPLIGTAVHALLLEADAPVYGGYEEAVLVPYGAWHGPDWLKEQRVNVGSVNGHDVEGNADLFHISSGTVVDLKVVGASTLNEARRHGPTLTYKRQIMLYGRGFQRAGFDVHSVTIAYLPRNSMRLSDAVFSTWDYDEQIAIDALNRATELLNAARDIERSFNTLTRDIWIDGLVRASGCYDCARYPVMMTRTSALAAEYATTHQGTRT